MKRISLICGLIAASITSGFAQDDDALTFAGRGLRFTLTDPVLGSARYSGMAGAMGALGGDGGAIKDNPASLGIYRKTDIGITFNDNVDNEGNGHFNINNFSAVINFGKKNKTSSGYVTSSLGVAYNRLANYNRDTYTEGQTTDGTQYTNDFLENNGSGVWNFAYGLNIRNKFYAGLGINAMKVSYEQSTQTQVGGDYEENNFSADGTGTNLSLGVIVKPADFLRVGASITSPTWMTINESAEYPERDEDGNLQFDDYGRMIYSGYGYDYRPEAEYKMQLPMKATASLGFVIDKRAVIGLDYAYQNFSSLKMKDDRDREFRDTKYFIENNYQGTHTLKAGAEVQIVKGFAVRAGYAFQSSPTNDDCYKLDNNRTPLNNNGLYVPYQYESILYSYSIPREAQYFTAGAGYHGKIFYCDLAYVNKQQKEDFYEWQEQTAEGDWAINPIDQKVKTYNIMLSLGVKF